ncbi:peptidase S10 [Albitalea terrae]|uniref:Peptidase S10 n=2 Tax=Piscinibacter terrae TaxID=2496871 RepID=A0A3N7HLP8_9BURK|nr:peptidase S10 [Albitalea terrae]
MAAVASIGLASCGGGGGGGGTAPPAACPSPPPAPVVQDSLTDSTVYSTSASASLSACAVEAAAATKHSITLGGTPLAYTATAGHLVARDPGTNAEEASFFYVAYTADGANPATRPVTFFYNGGPGSASIWLHLGSFGPKRLVTGDPATNAPTPFPLVDNAETLLDVSDLVFVDAIGTGYSEAISPNTNQSFWGVDKDAAAFRDFIVRYLAANGRNASPKFLFGESYGTTRTGVLSHLMETAGVSLKGIVLQSSVLNYATNCDQVTMTVSCAGYLPTYGEVGAYYSLTNPVPTDSGTYAAQMRSFTSSTYDPALADWLASRTPPSAGLATQLQNLTGLPASQWVTKLNVDPGTFQFNLVAGKLIGRYDARVSAPTGSALASEGDPSSTFISAQFGAAIGPYLSNTLHYANASSYVTLSNAINTWNFSHDGKGVPDVVPDLAAAMAQNPALKVLSVNGYHDLATPFHQTERDLARLDPNPNIAIKVYDGGHMTYLDDASRVKEGADVRTFYQSLLSR